MRIIFLIILALPVVSFAAKAQSRKQYAVLDISEGKDLLKQCSRLSPANVSGFWSPTEQEIQEVEKQLLVFLKSENRDSIADRFSFYGRQYVGFVREGKRFIYMNAFPFGRIYAKFVKTWKTDPITTCDGGLNYWGVEYDMESKKFLNLSFNGHA